MDGYFSQFWNDLVARVTGPLSFRLILQPIMASIFAIRDGLKDAKTRKPPYFYAIFTDPIHREAMLNDGWHAVAKVFILAMILDCIFQLFVFKWIHPVEVVLIAFLLAFNPYLLLRGLVNRITAWSFARKSVQKLSIALLSVICLQFSWSIATAQPSPAQPSGNAIVSEVMTGSVETFDTIWRNKFSSAPIVCVGIEPAELIQLRASRR